MSAIQPKEHKPSRRIVRSLRAFRNAGRLRLLRCVVVATGAGACAAARQQANLCYLGGAVPPLPLPQCTAATCACEYRPRGTESLGGLRRAAPQWLPWATGQRMD